MAEYCDSTDILGRVGELELVADGSDPGLLESLLRLAIEQSGAEIDVFVGVVSDVDAVRVETPRFLTLIAADLAADTAIRNSGASPSESIAERASDARSRLRDIAAGIIPLKLTRPVSLRPAFKSPRYVIPSE